MSTSHDPRISARHRFWVTRLFCVSIIILPYLLSSSYWHHSSSWITHLLAPLGIVLAAVGALGRVWCSSYISGNKNARLVMVGPYALMRNPLYVFSYVGGLGIAITTETLLIPLLFTCWFFWYHQRVVAGEEQFLMQRFGDVFTAYLQRTPRFFPRLHNFDFDAPLRWELSPPSFRRSLTHAIWFVIAAVILHAFHDLRALLDLPAIVTLY